MSEAGHAKNVANFETLINIIIALGLRYQPSNPSILLTALQILLGNAKAKIQEQIEELQITDPKNLEEQALSLVGRIFSFKFRFNAKFH